MAQSLHSSTLKVQTSLRVDEVERLERLAKTLDTKLAGIARAAIRYALENEDAFMAELLNQR